MGLLFCFAFIFLFVLLSGCNNITRSNEDVRPSFVYNKSSYYSPENNIYDNEFKTNNKHYNETYENKGETNDNYLNEYQNETCIDYKNITIHFTPPDNRMVTSGINSLIIMPNGSLWGWGLNLFGGLGDGTHMPTNIPIQVGTDVDWTQLATGLHHTLTIKDNGSLWSWGFCLVFWLDPANANAYPTNEFIRTSPIRFGYDYDWKSIFTGTDHAFGIKTDGSLWAWGRNRTGMLGDGTTISRYKPVQIGDNLNWVLISPGRDNTFGLKRDGTLWAWGSNTLGRLGVLEHTLSSRYQAYPIQIGTNSHWIHVSTGGGHTIALQENGSLWAWGDNRFGQLGDGTTTNRIEPVQVGIETKWVHAVAGDQISYAICIDGYLWSWGWNHNGELGIGTTENSSIPVQVGTNSNWVDIVAAARPLAKTDCGAIWSWGPGEVRIPHIGPLGDGINEDQLIPVMIIPPQL